MSGRPNRFIKLPYINVDLIRIGFWSGVFFNVGIILFILLGFVSVSVFLLSRSSTVQAEEFDRVRFPVVLVSVTPTPVVFSLSSPIPTATPRPSPSPLPSVIFTPIPTITPLPTREPISFTLFIPPTPLPPKRLYNFNQLQAISRSIDFPHVESSYAFGFYRALCVPAVPPFVQPRVVGLAENKGLIWRLWNDYGWSSDLDFSNDITFYLSEDVSVFHLALFWYDDRVSDLVDIDYPGSCPSTQVIYIQAQPPIADNVEVDDVVISQAQ